MPKSRVVLSPDASKHLSKGIDLIADLLAATLGPTSGYVVNERAEKRGPEFLDDSGVIVRRIISLPGQEEDIGAMLLRHLVWRVGDEVGDGGAMAGVLARALYKDALRLVTAGASAVSIEQGVNEGVKAVVAALRKQAMPITDENKLAHVARLIVHDDPLAAVLGEMSYLLGANAQVIIENYEAAYLQRRYIAGTHFPAQILSPHFYIDVPHKQAVLTDTAIALTDHSIEDIEQVVAMMQAALKSGHSSLFIIAPHISEKALGVLVANHRASEIKLTIGGAMLKDSGDARHFAYTDLSLITGATLLGNQHGRTTDSIRPEDLGYAKRVDIGQEGIVVIADSYQNARVQAEVIRINEHLATLPTHAENRPLLTKRLAALIGGIGELKIGALSKPARQLRRQQAERALKVLSLAQRCGVASGGGAALVHCGCALDHVKLEGDAAIGIQVLRRALAVPMRQILDNAKLDDAGYIISEVQKAGSPMTYDVLQNKLINAQQSGLLDPVEVLVAVVTKAASTAMKALSTAAIIYHRNPTVEGTTP